jgi:DNA (cytosine-5)-methyltransferase 1
MLQLARGRAMELIVGTLERLGYKWAYRVVDSRSLGLPQRRRRVYLLASRAYDPRTVLFADEAGAPEMAVDHRHLGCGFYWTEGNRGLGWAVDSIPTLKGGSGLGIPSPPAIILPSGVVVKPDIRDAERLQGFRAGWTKPAEQAARPSLRWKLIGNAVSVPVAEWIGRRLIDPGPSLPFETCKLPSGHRWPTAAWNVGFGRLGVAASEWPKRKKLPHLADFLSYTPEPLSAKATEGFLSRARASRLRFPDGFLDTLEHHAIQMKTKAFAS